MAAAKGGHRMLITDKPYHKKAIVDLFNKRFPSPFPSPFTWKKRRGLQSLYLHLLPQ